jgi:hypothetical protein
MSHDRREASQASSEEGNDEDRLPPPAFLPGLRPAPSRFRPGDDVSRRTTPSGFRRIGDLDGEGVAELCDRMAEELRTGGRVGTSIRPDVGALEATLRGLVAGYLLAREQRAPGA